jgi:beta-galactosidase
VAALLGLAATAGSAEEPAASSRRLPSKHRLFVGTCYQPVDRSPEEIRKDIALMRAAGFTLVRMGDLSWDAFEPSDDDFQFAWFDEILEQMGKAVDVSIAGEKEGVISGMRYDGTLHLGSYEVDLLQ